MAVFVLPGGKPLSYSKTGLADVIISAVSACAIETRSYACLERRLVFPSKTKTTNIFSLPVSQVYTCYSKLGLTKEIVLYTPKSICFPY